MPRTSILAVPLLLALACETTLKPDETSPGGPGNPPGAPVDNGDGTVTVIDPNTGQPVIGVIDPDTGEVVDPDTGQPIGTPNNPDSADPSEPAQPLADCDTPGPRMIRRLTAEQYKNTLTHLLGEGDDFPVEVVLSDPAVKGFHVDADAALVSDLTAELLMNYAERVTAWTMEKQRWKLASCSNHDATCHEQVVREFGRRAFRQELTQSQVDTYMSLFAAEESFDAGLHIVVSTMLQSPYVLYRRELGEPDPANPGQVRLTPYEVASELSYLLTDSPPDDQLLDLAAEGRLSTDERNSPKRQTACSGKTRPRPAWLTSSTVGSRSTHSFKRPKTRKSSISPSPCGRQCSTKRAPSSSIFTKTVAPSANCTARITRCSISPWPISTGSGA